MIPLYNKQGLLIGHKLSPDALNLGLKNKETQKGQKSPKLENDNEKKDEHHESPVDTCHGKGEIGVTAVDCDRTMLDSQSDVKESVIKMETDIDETVSKQTNDAMEREGVETVDEGVKKENEKNLDNENMNKITELKEKSEKDSDCKHIKEKSNKTVKTKEEIELEEEKAEILKGLGLERTPKANEIRKAMKAQQLKSYPLRRLGKKSSPGTSPLKDQENMDDLPLHDKIALRIKEESLAKSSPGDKGPFKCPTCKRSYRTKESFNSHVEFCDFEISTSDDEEEENDKKTAGRYPMRKTTVVQRLAMESEERERNDTDTIIKKRGRPLKDKSFEKVNSDLLSPNVKRRGRPSKESCEKFVESDVENSQKETTVVRRRGRPSKESADTSEECEKLESDTTPTSKRRGRPPKSESDKSVGKMQSPSPDQKPKDKEIKSQSLSQSVETMRRRGRPSLNKRETEKCNDGKRIRTPTKAMIDFILDFDSLGSEDDKCRRNIDTNTSSDSPRKVGRPRKRSIDSSMNSSLEISTPRKRGRPSKSSNLSPKVVLDKLTPSKFKASTPNKRGRGRPPKLQKPNYLGSKGGILKKYVKLKRSKISASEMSRKRCGSPMMATSRQKHAKLTSDGAKIQKRSVGRPPKKKILTEDSDKEKKVTSTVEGSKGNPITLGSSSETEEQMTENDKLSKQELASQETTNSVIEISEQDNMDSLEEQAKSPSISEKREITLDEQTGMVIDAKGSVFSPSRLLKESPNEKSVTERGDYDDDSPDKSNRTPPSLKSKNVFDILAKAAASVIEEKCTNQPDDKNVTESGKVQVHNSAVRRSENQVAEPVSNKNEKEVVRPSMSAVSGTNAGAVMSDSGSKSVCTNTNIEKTSSYDQQINMYGSKSLAGKLASNSLEESSLIDLDKYQEKNPSVCEFSSSFTRVTGSHDKLSNKDNATIFKEKKPAILTSPIEKYEYPKGKVISPKKSPECPSSPDLRYAAQLIKHLPAKDVENLVGLSRFSSASQIASLITSLVEKNAQNKNTVPQTGNEGFAYKNSENPSSSRKTTPERRRSTKVASRSKPAAICRDAMSSAPPMLTSNVLSSGLPAGTTGGAIKTGVRYTMPSAVTSIQSQTREAISRLLHRSQAPFSEQQPSVIYTSMQSQIQGLQPQVQGLQAQVQGLQAQVQGLQPQVQGLQTQITGQELMSQPTFNMPAIQQVTPIQTVAISNPIQQVPPVQVIQQSPTILTLPAPPCQQVVVNPVLGSVPIQNSAIANSFQTSGFVGSQIVNMNSINANQSSQLVNMNSINTNQSLLPSNILYGTNIGSSVGVNPLIQTSVLQNNLGGFTPVQNSYSTVGYSADAIQSIHPSIITSVPSSVNVGNMSIKRNENSGVGAIIASSQQQQSNSTNGQSKAIITTPTTTTNSNTIVRIFIDGKPVAMTTDASVLNMQDHSSLLSKLGSSKLQAGKYTISVSSHSVPSTTPKILPAITPAITPVTSPVVTTKSSPSKDHKVLHSMLQSKIGLGEHALGFTTISKLNRPVDTVDRNLPSIISSSSSSSASSVKKIVTSVSASSSRQMPLSNSLPVSISPSSNSEIVKKLLSCTSPAILTTTSLTSISSGGSPVITSSLMTPLSSASQIQKKDTLTSLRNKIVGSQIRQRLIPAFPPESFRNLTVQEKSAIRSVVPQTSFIRRQDGSVIKRTVMKPNLLHRKRPSSVGGRSKRAVISIGEKNGLATGMVSKALVRKIVKEVNKNETGASLSGVNVVKMSVEEFKAQLEREKREKQQETGGQSSVSSSATGILKKSRENIKRSPMKKSKISVNRRKTPLKPRNISHPHTSGSVSHPIIHAQKEVPVLPQPAVEEEVTDTPMYSVFEHEARAQKQKEELRRKNGPHLKFEIISDDGFSCQADTMDEAWKQVTEKVQDARAAARLKNVSYSSLSGASMFGLNHHAIIYLVEQLYGAVHCRSYKFKFHDYDHLAEEEISVENPSGSVRSEPYQGRKPFDIFSFLMSQYRQMPAVIKQKEDIEMVHKSSRRATSMELPMAMRFRKLKDHAREAVGVFRSNIHGRGLFCKRTIDAGEMVIEYSGEVIRASLTDKREQYYERKGIGCYMFRIDDQEVVDATLHGSAARFINHSCEPNCYSKVIQVDGKKHIVIFAMRQIVRGEELTYDYKFPIEEVKIPCTCGSKKCRKYLN
ncbi:hypothetical protein KUTeg_006307 [Tegillarca granosa]|uniref:Uncharacterized protein n=1 Tax=Tegillarca granosa TaxID=220873 RepID=A0ABQ9FG50_TEGGR|nr:hypothetical protein KUTeg_006307 [Tegillarca granosa]